MVVLLISSSDFRNVLFNISFEYYKHEQEGDLFKWVMMPPVNIFYRKGDELIELEQVKIIMCQESFGGFLIDFCMDTCVKSEFVRNLDDIVFEDIVQVG